jgi:hypothetical protein
LFISISGDTDRTFGGTAFDTVLLYRSFFRWWERVKAWIACARCARPTDAPQAERWLLDICRDYILFSKMKHSSLSIPLRTGIEQEKRPIQNKSIIFYFYEMVVDIQKRKRPIQNKSIIFYFYEIYNYNYKYFIDL